MTLKDEVNDMWLASVGMPAINNMRIMARKNLLPPEDAAKVMQVPLKVYDLFEIVLRHREALIREFSNDFGVPFHVETIQHYMDILMAKRETQSADTTATTADQSSTVLVFDDEQSASELVFGVAVNHKKKRIIVAFRGSVTSNDYKADFKVLMKRIRHPSDPNQHLSVHGGIYQYLHRKRKDGTSKWDVIQVYLKDIMEEHPGYALYLTGHSLGGSLAILLAFQLAATDSSSNGTDVAAGNDEDKKDDAAPVQGPISVISFGPMLVGDLRFRRAFQQFEQERKLRCLCVVNEGDFIPLIPERGRPLTAYRRVGVYLRLSPGQMVFSYAARAPSYVGAWWRDVPNQILHRIRLAHTLCCVKNFSANHNVHHYTENIISCEADLSKVDWDLFEAGRNAGGFIYDVW